MPKRTSIRERLLVRYKKREAKVEKLQMLQAILTEVEHKKNSDDIDYIHDLMRRIHRLQTQLKNLSTVPLQDDL
jgi:hypothetical protein